VNKDEFEKVQEIVAEGIAAEGLEDAVLSEGESAAERLAGAVSDEAVDRMIADAQESGLSLLDGPDGIIGRLTARIIERSLGAEMDGHLGCEKGDPGGRGSGNSRVTR
jgi:putative transposase